MDLNSYIAGLRDALRSVPDKCTCIASAGGMYPEYCGGWPCPTAIRQAIANKILQAEHGLLDECLPVEEHLTTDGEEVEV